jgi:AcrR family transcriptional regulator
LAAALDGLAEVGYDRLSMEEIAARARAGKATLYRRWPSKAALVVDAIVAWREGVAPLAIPDTGSLAGDLAAVADAVPDFNAAAEQQLAVIVGLTCAASRDEALRTALSTHALERPRRAIGEILQRAADRGELASGYDLDLAIDAVIGLNLMQLIRGASITRAFVRRVLFQVLYPVVTGHEA